MFKGGIIQNIHSSNLSNESLQDSNNVMTNKGSCRIRKGLEFVLVTADVWYKNIYRFYPNQGDCMNINWE